MIPDPGLPAAAAWESVLDGTAPPAADATDEPDGNQPRTFANGAPMRLPAQPSLAEQAAAARARLATAAAAEAAFEAAGTSEAADAGSAAWTAWAAWAADAAASAFTAYAACAAWAAGEQSDEDAAADLVATARASYDCSRDAVDYLAGIVSDTVRQYQAAMTERGHAAAVLAAAELAQAELIASRG